MHIGDEMENKDIETLKAEIERFKTESLKTHVVKVWAESYTNSDPFGYAILEKENNKVWWMKTQAHQLWEMWQAAKATPEGFVLVEASEFESLKSDNKHFTESCIDWTDRAYKQRAKVEFIKNEVERFKQSGTDLDLGKFLDNLIEFSTFKHDEEFEDFVLVRKELPEEIAESMALERVEKPVTETDPTWIKISEDAYKGRIQSKKWELWRDYKAMVEAQEQSHD